MTAMKYAILIVPLLLVGGGCVADDDPPGEYPLRMDLDRGGDREPDIDAPPSTPPPPASYDENEPGRDPIDTGMGTGGM